MKLRSLELRIPPVIVFGVAIVSIVALARKLPAGNVPFAGHDTLGTAAFAVGAAVAVAGLMAFSSAGTTVDPTRPAEASTVVSTGIYRWTRNPMYLGMALILLGGAARFATLPGVAVVALFCAYMTRFQIIPEERALETGFGQAYRDYRKRVRRWL